VDLGPDRPTRGEVWGAVLVAVAAVALRFVRLGALSLAGDEETTALAAAALLDSGTPTLPGELVYVRALPFTVLESGAMALFGSGEAALRAVPALLAGPRILATWWLARPFLGAPLALAAAALLAVAPLDVELSRTARMYSLFATLDLVFLASVVYFARGSLGRVGFGAGVLSGVAGAFTHSLAAAHACVPWAAAAATSPRKYGRRLVLIGAGAVVLVAYGADLMFNSRFREARVGRVDGPASLIVDHLQGLAALVAEPLGLALALAAAGAAIGGGLVALRRLETPWGRIAAGAAALSFAVAIPTVGALLIVGFLILEGLDLRRALPSAAPILAGGAAASAAWAGAALAAGEGVRGAADQLLGFPAPNWADLAQVAPALFALASLGTILAPQLSARSGSRAAWLALVVAFAGALLLTGFHSRREGVRFHLHLMAPMIVLALAGARVLLEALPAVRPRTAAVGAVVVVALALRPDYTLAALTRVHGPTDNPYVTLHVAPDHRSAGRFVRERAAAEEWIAAEDALQQQWWIGRVDVWLRKREDAAAYLERRAPGAPLRDTYTGALHVSDLDELRKLASERGREVVWLVTSGEVEVAPSWYRTPEDEATLDRWESRAWFVASDRLTRVYRLEGGRPVSPLENVTGEGR
jgi:hypothetical protein